MFLLKVNDGLELRLLTEAHSSLLFRLINRNRAMLRQWLPWVDGTRSLDDTRRFIRFGLRQHAKRNGLHAGVWVEQQLAGIISFNYLDQGKRQTEIGYWLGQDFQGRGLMSAACRAMIHYAFTRLGLERIEIRCAAANSRSRAIPERLGFEQEGIIPQLEWQTETYVDTVVYSMTAAAWAAREGDLNDRENRRHRQL
jgi:ribosomal-protein-serine acetyltransferase